GRAATSRAQVRADDRSRRADDLADATGAVRRRLYLGRTRPRVAPAPGRDRTARVRGERRPRPDDPAALFAPPRRADPTGTTEDLSRRGPRLPVPAPRRVRRRRGGVPHVSGVIGVRLSTGTVRVGIVAGCLRRRGSRGWRAPDRVGEAS